MSLENKLTRIYNNENMIMSYYAITYGITVKRKAKTNVPNSIS